MESKIVIFDLDGTIANVDHRRHLVSGKKKDFAAFHALAHLDKPHDWAVQLSIALGDKYRIFIVSARPMSMLTETILWLIDNNFRYDHLALLRLNGDSTPDIDLKRAWLNNQNRSRILFAVDDRTRVVNMWREEGIPCLQCDNWEERKKDEGI